MPLKADVASWFRDLFDRIEPGLRGRYRMGLALLAADAGFAALPLLAGAWVIGEIAADTWDSGKAWIAAAIVVSSFLARLVVMPAGFARGFEAGYGAVAGLRLALFAHLRRLGLGTTSRIGAARLSDLVTHRFRWFEEEAGYGLGRQIGHAILTLALILALAHVHLAFLGTIALLVLIAALVYRRVDRAFARLARDQASLVANAAERMVEYLTGLPVLRALGQVGAHADAYRRQVEALHAFYRGTIGTVAPLVSAARILLDLTLLSLIAVAVGLFAFGSLGAPGLVVALVLVLLLQPPLEASIGEGFMLRLVGDAHGRAAAILEQPPLDEGAETPRSGEIRFEDIRFEYDSDRPVLDRFDLVLPAGKVSAVIGPSGAGKSTLLTLIARASDGQAGRITIGGQDIRSVPLDRHLARLGVVPQDVFLFSDTLANNLRIARPEATEAECRAAAERTCCSDFIAQLPEGMETRLGEGGHDLSGGERQRVAIARALLKDAEIVLLDEATSALDAESEHGVVEGLQALRMGRTVVMIAHRLQTVARADHVVVMEAGRVVDSGTPAELAARCPLYRELWDAYRDTERWRLSDHGLRD